MFSVVVRQPSDLRETKFSLTNKHSSNFFHSLVNTDVSTAGINYHNRYTGNDYQGQGGSLTNTEAVAKSTITKAEPQVTTTEAEPYR